jgi:hypothetical protein
VRRLLGPKERKQEYDIPEKGHLMKVAEARLQYNLARDASPGDVHRQNL